jgi:hypothetical protein
VFQKFASIKGINNHQKNIFILVPVQIKQGDIKRSIADVVCVQTFWHTRFIQNVSSCAHSLIAKRKLPTPALHNTLES